MDSTFTFFVFIAATAIAIGGALVLVGYIYIMPSSFARGWKWGVLTSLPVIVTALYMGLRGLLPADSNKTAFFLLFASLLGPVIFCARHWRDNRKPGIQMLIGLVFMVAAIALVYGGLGQQFADKIVNEVQQRESEAKKDALKDVPKPAEAPVPSTSQAQQQAVSPAQSMSSPQPVLPSAPEK